MLNIKRGILSTIQLDETATLESDVNGKCETKVVRNGRIIVKTKTLSECSDRAQDEIGIQSASIKTSSDLKPLNSKSTCIYKVSDDETIADVKCEENHLFRPFSATYETTSGAMTLVKQSMKLIDFKNINYKFDQTGKLKFLLFFVLSNLLERMTIMFVGGGCGVGRGGGGHCFCVLISFAE